MKDFLQNIIQQIVENPDAVVIEETQEEGRTNLLIKVADEDMGRVIGKEGKVINSIRMILRVMAIRQNVRVRVDIEDNRPAAEETTAPAEETTSAPQETTAPAPEQPQVVETPPAQPAADSTPEQPVAAPDTSPADPQPVQAPAAATQAAPVAEPSASDLVGQPNPGTTVLDNSQKTG